MNEEEKFSKFNDSSAFVWEQEDLLYGDWTAGLNGDGIFTTSIEFIPTEVN